MTFYDKFEALCTEIEKKPREIAKEAGVKTSTLSMWKTKGVTPKYGTIKQIATILNVEWTELVPEEQQEKVIIDQVLQAWQPKTTPPDTNPIKAKFEPENTDTENDPYVAVACAIPSIFHARIFSELEKLGISRDHITRESPRATIIGEGFIVDWLTPSEAKKVAYCINEYLQQLI